VDLSLHQLRLLREVADRGTIAAAAEAAGYTPSAVSQQLAGLEKAAGTPVLERVGRNVRLTDAGRELVRHAETLLAQLEEAQVALERLGTDVRGTVEISVFESAAATLLAPTLTRIGARFPELRLRTRQMDPDAAFTALGRGDIDLAFVLDYPHAPGPQPADIERLHICTDWFRLVVPSDYSIRAGPVELASLAGHDFVASPPDLSCGRCISQACRDAGFEPDITHQLDDYPTTLRLIAGGAGISLIPDLGLIDIPPGVRVLELDRPMSRSLQLGYRKASAGRPGLQAVCEIVLEVARELELDLSRAAA
jgi:molybdate transport repressor ModE-like protein